MKHTEETKRKISENNKGKKGYWFGKHPSLETRKKQSDSHKGKICSEETRKKIGEGNKGKVVSQEAREKISNTLKGHGFTEESRQKMSDSKRGEKSYWFGRKLTDEHKKNLSISAKNRPPITDEHRKILSDAQRKRFKNSTVSENQIYKNTKPELEAEQILIKNNINYIKQKQLKNDKGVRFYDLYLPDYNLLIEIDGCYWHSKNVEYKDIKTERLRKIRNNDNYKEYLAKQNGYDLLRIWEDELDKLEEFCNIMLFYRKTS